METRVDEIADGIYRLSTFVPSVGGPAGFTFNEFLIDADEPLLFDCGQRSLFASVSACASRVVDPARLRWITYSHVEADECGALAEWLAAAPDARPAHGRFGCDFWLNDTSPRPPRMLADGETIDLGGKRVRWLDTPNVPHDLAAGLLYEETTGTLFCSDLFAHGGDAPALTGSDILGPAIETLKRFPFTPVTPQTAPTLRRLAALSPRTLAVMHGASVSGDGKTPLEGLAAYYEAQLQRP
jgi:flavorubredoxin